MESLRIGNFELRPVTQPPKITQTLSMPVVQTDKGPISLATHTDTLLTLLRGAHDITAGDLLIEGRVLTKEQERALQNHPDYQFYLNGRLHRATGSRTISYLLSPEVAPQNVKQLLDKNTASNPRSLQEEIGYSVGFYRLVSLIRLATLSYSDVSPLIPVLGGCTELVLGSNTLSDEVISGKLAQLKIKMVQADPFTILNNLQPRTIKDFKRYPVGKITTRKQHF